MPPISRLLVAGFILAALPAYADDTIETVIVTGDRAHLIETQPDDTALGLSMPLIETPRAVTAVSDTTIDRYGITGVDTLTAITPSAYTASFYGVEGAVNLRGTLAESYFRGFKRADNRGTYATPLGDAAADRDFARAAFGGLWRRQGGRAGQFRAQERDRLPGHHRLRRGRPPAMAAIPSAISPARSACRLIWAAVTGRRPCLWRDR